MVVIGHLPWISGPWRTGKQDGERRRQELKPAKLVAQVEIGSSASPQKRHSKISARITYGNLMILGGPSTSNQRPEKPEDAPVAPSINEPTLFRDGGVFLFHYVIYILYLCTIICIWTMLSFRRFLVKYGNHPNCNKPAKPQWSAIWCKLKLAIRMALRD